MLGSCSSGPSIRTVPLTLGGRMSNLGGVGGCPVSLCLLGTRASVDPQVYEGWA